jgi:hypothetical protein
MIQCHGLEGTNPIRGEMRNCFLYPSYFVGSAVNWTFVTISSIVSSSMASTHFFWFLSFFGFFPNFLGEFLNFGKKRKEKNSKKF